MTTPTNDTYSTELSALAGKQVHVSKGCSHLGIKKHMTGEIVAVTFHPDYGFKCVFNLLRGSQHSMYAASIARFRGPTISLNTGNPLERVVLEKIG